LNWHKLTSEERLHEIIGEVRKSSPRATEALRQDFALHKYRRERLRKDRRRLLSLTDRAWRYANKA
ncbi:hypothetical protein PC129_g15443, partial [Phytophthora cactorum]